MCLGLYGGCCVCSCEKSCKSTGRCCPDFIEIDAFDDGANMSVIEQTCIPLKLGPTQNYFESGYFGYINCHNGPLQLKQMCEIEYKSQEATLSDMVPCVSNTTHTYYRNKHCALCHGEMENNLEYLTVDMTCKHPPFSEEINIKRSVFETRNCDIVFDRNIATIYNEKYCRTSIDRCNIKGLWVKYDSEWENACHTDHSVIQFPYDDLRHQNLFCFLCNGLEVKMFRPDCFDDEDVSDRYSFSGLLKIDTPTSTVVIGNTILKTKICE
ncbi:hypothetical protein DPMN_159113 [Dreissena polymorpha]|uniref:SMB domain-containing protein n=1 Tax=Dreissena polymorpha TaxID=45954 RepID=A0A9D4EMP6_DREPO|nr:hypothetical protein DPMN_159113 [Dreissena polymorpha]